MNRLIFVLLFGLSGAAVLIALGTWQLQRLGWKEAILAQIENRIAAAPVALPDAADAARDQYLAVEASGTLGEDHLRILVSRKQIGAGYRVIRALDTGDRRVLVDLGFTALEDDAAPRPEGGIAVTGNLLWPEEVDGFTPEPDIERNIWFARDLPAMAAALEAEPLLIVAREVSPDLPGLVPLPIDGAGIPNDHLQYAITWFSLAAIWLGMSAVFLLRRRDTADAKGRPK